MTLWTVWVAESSTAIAAELQLPLVVVDGATAALTELGVRLVEFSKRRNVGIICISHVNDDGKTKYAKSIEEEAIMLIELKRDMKAEGDDANYTTVEVTKNRPYSRLGEAGRLHYNPEPTIVKGV